VARAPPPALWNPRQTLVQEDTMFAGEGTRATPSIQNILTHL